MPQTQERKETHKNNLATKEFVHEEIQEFKSDIHTTFQEFRIELKTGLRQNLLATILVWLILLTIFYFARKYNL